MKQQINQDLFSLELLSLTDLSVFLSWEISHLQGITELASQLHKLIAASEFKPVSEVKRVLE